MGRTTEEPIPVEESYRDILRSAIAKVGSQTKVGKLAGVNQGTISRTIEPNARATYTTLVRLSRVLPGVPSPIAPVRNAQHEKWCRVGGELSILKPDAFALILGWVENALDAPMVAPPPAPEPEGRDPLVERVQRVAATSMVAPRRARKQIRRR